MADFVGYHNPDTMGHNADEVDGFQFLTDKNISSVVGSRLWLLTGEEHPRVYYLVGHFTPTKRSPYAKGGFRWLLEGPPAAGVELPRRKWPILNDEDWFDDFRASQGNFGLGLQAITNKRYVRGLESALKRAGS